MDKEIVVKYLNALLDNLNDIQSDVFSSEWKKEDADDLKACSIFTHFEYEKKLIQAIILKVITEEV